MAPTCAGWKALQRGGDLAGQDLLGLAPLALVPVLPDADDGRHRVPDHRRDGRPDLLVGLTEEAPALGVADDHVGHPEPFEHRRADLAGERTLLFEVAVLRAESDRDAPVLEDRLDGTQVDERWVHRHVYGGDVRGVESHAEILDRPDRGEVVVDASSSCR